MSAGGSCAVGLDRLVCYPGEGGMTPERMRAIRRRLGVTQKEMANYLRLAPKGGADTIRSWEAGRRPPSGPVTVIYEALEDGRLRLSREEEGC